MLISPPRFKFSSPEAIGAMDGHAKLLLCWIQNGIFQKKNIQNGNRLLMDFDALR